MSRNIIFVSENTDFVLPAKEKNKKWLSAIAKKYGKKISELNYIFCNDEYLLDINVKYLDHDTLTDIITFDNSDGGAFIVSDIFISVERVKENAEEFKVSFETELKRVMAHGLLHILGYKDKTDDDALKMRKAEDESIALFDTI